MKLDWSKGEGLIPVIVQDVKTREVLMLAYMNEEAFELTRKTGELTFYSRSRREIWKKGETSGNRIHVVDIKQDCDGDTLLILAEPTGPACHRLTSTCFDQDGASSSPSKKENLLLDFQFLKVLEKTIEDRFQKRSSGSYISRLIEEGLDRIAQKVGEEAVETVIASKNLDQSQFESEASDLLFHLMVLLRYKNSSLGNLVRELERRHQP